jgi:hypothetical protein
MQYLSALAALKRDTRRQDLLLFCIFGLNHTHTRRRHVTVQEMRKIYERLEF